MSAEQERECIEDGCEEIAGTPWTHLWCLKHDEERRERIHRLNGTDQRVVRSED